ncbi:LuxR C-terminal-related transcriptional regulator [Nonomuraea sp. NPDC050790]|uniref:helix-turn-helix transcriptional regulator n=1 Tax=Nonomuraea sp. NPDC050790 TaxID=3364371 RepID=UPI0037BC0C7E
MIFGRDRELSAMRAARRLVMVQGPEGIGKTALLHRFLDDAGDSIRVLRAEGEECEAGFAFGTLTQLLDRPPARDDPCAAGAELLDRLRAARDVVLVVDNLQWVDRDSLVAIVFALRRLRDESVLAVLSGRAFAHPESLRRLLDRAGATSVSLDGLPIDAFVSLFSGVLPVTATRRLWEHTAGNPRHAGEVVEGSAGLDLAGPFTVLPAPYRHDRLAAAALERCSPPARRLLRAASVLTSISRGVPVDWAARLAEVDEPTAVLEESGLLKVYPAARGLCVTFEDPLVGRAVYLRTALADRLAAHARAAELVTGDLDRLEHRWRGLTRFDGRVAGDIADAGRRAAADGAWAEAAGLLLRARTIGAVASADAVEALVFDGRISDARATADDHDLFAQGVLACAAGRFDEARRLLTRARNDERSPSRRQRIAEHLTLGCDGDPASYLDLMRHGNSHLARMLDASVRSLGRYRSGDWDEAEDLAGVAVCLAGQVDGCWPAAYAYAVASLVPAARGNWQAAERLVRLARSAGPYGAAACAEANLAAAQQRHDDVIRALADLPAPPFGPELLAEALIAVGDLDGAASVHRAGDPGLRVSALLAAALNDPGRASVLFEQAIAQAADPFERARGRLAYGSFLRRMGRRTRAAEHLQAAWNTLDDLRAAPFQRRCAIELAACGRQRPAGAGNLTPQQLAVARLLALGKTNRQIARELTLSVKTVEYHISHTYRRLGVTNRVALTNALAST